MRLQTQVAPEIQKRLLLSRVEAESFAQFGRALYGGNPEVLDMFKSLFPNSYDEVSGRIERLIK